MDNEHARDFWTKSKDYVNASKLFVPQEDIENNFPKHTRFFIRKDLFATWLKYLILHKKVSHIYG